MQAFLINVNNRGMENANKGAGFADL